ncbi:MAG: hypothetical protein K2G69_08725 [Muribaculaceae bacterium]|nr:hypothetical protein [Muribaculaceae bacterium]
MKENETERVKNLLMDILTGFGCAPESDEEGNISVAYEGGCFILTFENETVTIWYTRWMKISLDDDIPLIKDLINTTNAYCAATIVYEEKKEQNVMLITTKYNLTLHPATPKPERVVRRGFALIFEACEKLKLYFGKASRDIYNPVSPQ